ncbi:MAG TPA: amylo-alpha-1,6-glucosidase [Saprospiraceae bacterium]|nr:amylo-alpha-1,6-glucosidase [Saprospiraceae bacterium]
MDDILQREWLVTNGIGGYASSTVLGMNTRKYHGLLVAALHPPRARTVCLSKLDEDIFVGSEVFRLGTNEFIDGFFPNGHAYLREFNLAAFPKYIYVANGVILEKTLYMPHGKNAVAIIYRLTNENDVDTNIRIYPLATCRQFHNVVDTEFNPLHLLQENENQSFALSCYNPKTTAIVKATEGIFVEKPTWIRRLLYREEAKRGESNLDDCYQPGYFEIALSRRASSEFSILAAADENHEECAAILKSVGTNTDDIKRSYEAELKQKAIYLNQFQKLYDTARTNDWLNWIVLAADSFLVSGKDSSRSLIAGYPWFEEWSRDAFISFPGLLLVTGRFSDAEKVLTSYARCLKNGLIPNFIPDATGEPAYNTVDATLWYVNAVLQYLKYTGDFRFVEENLWLNLKEIIESHERGTTNGVHIDTDGLLAHGPGLTWMDARVNGKPVTPRAGKAVEVQALWYNALRTVQLLARRYGHQTLVWRCSDMASKARESFDRVFWNKKQKCLFDVIDTSGADASLRPNQIVAASLDFPILHQDKAEPVVDMVQNKLLTPFGLRTLTPDDSRYHGRYAGDRRSRDEAYHNGTVWPWLLGPFVTAYIKVKGGESATREFACTNFIRPLFSQNSFSACLGTISEVFDGDPPHTAGGCISQAWSIGEPLRAYVEDVLRVRPKQEKEILQL